MAMWPPGPMPTKPFRYTFDGLNDHDNRRTIITQNLFLMKERYPEIQWADFPPILSLGILVPGSEHNVDTCDAPLRHPNAYLDQHLDEGFESFMDSSRISTPLTQQFLRVARDYLNHDEHSFLRSGLRLVVAHNLTFHNTTFILSENSLHVDNVADTTLQGIHNDFKLKLQLQWRKLHQEVLEGLSTLFDGFAHEGFDDYDMVLLLSGIMLIIWEKMEFHSSCYLVGISISNFHFLH